MARSAQAFEQDPGKLAKFAFGPASGVMAVWRCIADYADVCARYHAGARLYEELSCLSDAELRRRGLSRDTIAREICAACDRAALR
jgi:hypothetical protein